MTRQLTSRFQFIAPRIVVALAIGLALAFGLGGPLNAQVNPPMPQPKIIVVVGDSLSAGYGIAIDQAWPKLLEQRVQSKGYNYKVVNASVSGETSAGAAARITPLLNQHQPDIVILEIGANDGLRGLPLAKMRQNLATVIAAGISRSARILIVGMRIPPNYGERYTEDFFNLYADLAKQYQLARVPFLLDQVALDPALMQADGLHPVAAAQPRLLDNVWRELEPMLRSKPTAKTTKRGIP
jgi:acyl-CoA thioesterase I